MVVDLAPPAGGQLLAIWMMRVFSRVFRNVPVCSGTARLVLFAINQLNSPSTALAFKKIDEHHSPGRKIIERKKKGLGHYTGTMYK